MIHDSRFGHMEFGMVDDKASSFCFGFYDTVCT